MARTAVYFSRTYDEAMGMIHEARSYIAEQEPQDRLSLQPVDRLRLTRETMRLTARLTQVMAWLLAQRAVVAGELPEESLGRDFALTGHRVCLQASEDLTVVPESLQDLLERSRSLFARVARLDRTQRRRSRIH